MSPRHYALAHMIVLVWGVNFAVIKIGLASMPLFFLAALCFLLEAIPALLFLRTPKVPLKLYLAFGLVMSFGQFALLFSAIHVGKPSGWRHWCCNRNQPLRCCWLDLRNHLHPAVHRAQDALSRACVRQWTLAQLVAEAHEGSLCQSTL